MESKGSCYHPSGDSVLQRFLLVSRGVVCLLRCCHLLVLLQLPLIFGHDGSVGAAVDRRRQHHQTHDPTHHAGDDHRCDGVAQVDGPWPLLSFALGHASSAGCPAAKTLPHCHGDVEGVAGGMGVVAVGVASEQPLRLQVVDVSEQVVVACGHAGMEELVGNFLQVPVPHFFWVGANHLVQHSTLESELELKF